MKNLSKKNPVLYCILLVIIVMLAAAVLTGAFTVAGFRDLSSSIARIIIFAVLVFIFRDCYHWDKSFSGITYALAALIPAVWNIAYNSFNGAVLRSDLPVVLICALAPAVFEESLFRIIPFQKMEDQNMSKMSIVLITALVFGLIHLTNMVSGNVVGTLVQTFYAVAVGLLFGGLYILTKDPASVILAHFLTDFTSQMFTNQPSSTPVLQVIIFVVLLAVISVYGIMLTRKAEKEN